MMQAMRPWPPWSLVVLVIACGGSPKPAEPPAAPPAPTCDRTAGHMVDLLAEGKDPRPPDEVINGLIARIRTRCEEDGWTAEARHCLAKMQTAQDADDCGTLLTAAQQEALVKSE